MTANQVNGKQPLGLPVLGEVWPVTPPRTDPQAEADRATAAVLLAKANELHAKAGEDADRTRRAAGADLDRARVDAQRIRDEAAAETTRRKKSAGELDVWAARVVIAGAVGLTASGEYSLAKMVGFAPLSAWLLPLVIDVYVIQAFRRHRDIPPAIGLTIAANVIYHLAAVGMFGLTPSGKPEWWLIAVVASVASLILWRMHLMIAPPRARKARREAAVGIEDERPLERIIGAQVERADDARVGQVLSAQIERPVSAQVERVGRAQIERPQKPAAERVERAQRKPKKSAAKSVAERRRESVRALYVDLGKRPEWTEIRDALVVAKLADKTISRSSCQRIRDAIEADHPELAALGSPNVRSITGS